MREPEEKIPFHGSDVYFTVDCPSLHIIPFQSLGPRRYSVIPSDGLYEFESTPSYCPICSQVTTRTRQIPSQCLGLPGSASKSNLVHTPPLPLERLATPATETASLFRAPTFNRTHSQTFSLAAQLTPPEDVSTADFRPDRSSFPEPVSTLEFRPDRSSFPEPVSTLEFLDRRREGADGGMDRALSAPKSQKGIFGLKWPSKRSGSRQGSRASRAGSTFSQDSTGSSLPKFLSFSFSLTGQNLLVWKKDSEPLVRMELESQGGRVLDVGALLPGEPGSDKAVSIRHVAEGDEWIAAVVSHRVAHNRRLSLLVFHASGLREMSSLQRLDEQSEPRCLAVAPDNRHVAVGLGPTVLLLRYAGADRRGARVLPVREFAGPRAAEVRFQAVSFAADGSCLVVSTQKRDGARSDEDDRVYSHVWRCGGDEDDDDDDAGAPPLDLWPCHMPTDGQGLTSTYFHPGLSTGLVTGLTATPYALFTGPGERPRPAVPSGVADFRLRCSAAAASARSSHVLYGLDARDRLLRVDLRARGVRPVADLHVARGALRPAEEKAALAVTPDGGAVRVFWRQGPGLYLVDVAVGEAAAAAPQKTNLRSLWLDAVGDG